MFEPRSCYMLPERQRLVDQCVQQIVKYKCQMMLCGLPHMGKHDFALRMEKELDAQDVCVKRIRGDATMSCAQIVHRIHMALAEVGVRMEDVMEGFDSDGVPDDVAAELEMIKTGLAQRVDKRLIVVIWENLDSGQLNADVLGLLQDLYDDPDGFGFVLFLYLILNADFGINIKYIFLICLPGFNFSK